MERKTFVLLITFLFNVVILSAQTMNGGPLPLDIVPPPSNGNGDGPGRGQHPTIYVFYENHNLSFDDLLFGCTINLLDSGTIVFTDIVNENGVVYIPQSINGLYRLQLIVGEYVYEGEIYIE